MSFAYGAHALAICERCGRQISYLSLETEWNGARVCDECYEDKHPQLDPAPVKADAEALYQPSPERRLPLEVFTGRMIFPPLQSNIYHAMGIVGEVTAEVTEIPIPASVSVTSDTMTGAVGDITTTGAVDVTSVDVTGVAGTGSPGGVTVDVGTTVSVNVTGLAATGSPGSVTVVAKASTAVTGLAATGSPGSVTVSFPVTVSVTGLAATGSVGTQTNEILSANLVLNGDFPSATTSWTTTDSATIASVSGELRVTCGATFTGPPSARQQITIVNGANYRLRATYRRGTAATSAQLLAFNSGFTTDWSLTPNTTTSNVTYTNNFTADDTTIILFAGIYCNTNGQTGFFDNIQLYRVTT
jgi:hypothetical protein